MGIRNLTVASFVVVALFAGFKSNEKMNGASKMESDEVGSLSVTGVPAQALFEVLKSSGVAAETIDGRVIMGPPPSRLTQFIT
jgi:hypothetical protein